MTYQEKLERIRQRMDELKRVERELSARAKKSERKARTRRLIEVGAIMAHIGVETPEQAERLRQYIESAPEHKAGWLRLLRGGDATTKDY